MGAPNGQEEEDRIKAKVKLPAKTMDANTGENEGTRTVMQGAKGEPRRLAPSIEALNVESNP